MVSSLVLTQLLGNKTQHQLSHHPMIKFEYVGEIENKIKNTQKHFYLAYNVLIRAKKTEHKSHGSVPVPHTANPGVVCSVPEEKFKTINKK
jgi:hypothetical protein